MLENMLSIKTKDQTTVDLVQNRAANIEISGLNWLREDIHANNYAFLVFGGDNPPWETGLVGIVKIDTDPYDLGYDQNNARNFKVRITVVVYFNPPIKRETLVPYPDTYGTIGIAPIVKWEPNQAITSVSQEKATALIQAIMELHPETTNDIESILSQEENAIVHGNVNRFVLQTTPFGQTPTQDAPIEVSPSVEFPHNRIFFGAPGTGKSHQLEVDRLANFNERNYERVTFYPTYSYSQFVGSYKPTMVGNDVTYAYVPGPFIDILVKAKNNRSENFLLIIEELNRANAPAVFGDLFQLLDRLSDGSSEYPVVASHDLAKYLRSQGIEDATISLPPNLYIWATMNSADQGVFPIDTSFKRRWDFEYLDIDSNQEEIQGMSFTFADGSYEWNEIRKAINSVLLLDAKVNEDKLIGPFFIKKEIIRDASDAKFFAAFKSKVLMYLFEDAARHNRMAIFNSEIKPFSYSNICRNLDMYGLTKIFNSHIISLLHAEQPVSHEGQEQA